MLRRRKALNQERQAALRMNKPRRVSFLAPLQERGMAPHLGSL